MSRGMWGFQMGMRFGSEGRTPQTAGPSALLKARASNLQHSKPAASPLRTGESLRRLPSAWDDTPTRHFMNARERQLRIRPKLRVLRSRMAMCSAAATSRAPVRHRKVAQRSRFASCGKSFMVR